MRIENGLDDSDGDDVTGGQVVGTGSGTVEQQRHLPAPGRDLRVEQRLGTPNLPLDRAQLPSRLFVYQWSHAWEGGKGKGGGEKYPLK